MLIPIIVFVACFLIFFFILGAQRKLESKKDIYYNRLKEEYQAEVLKNKSALLSGRTYHARGQYQGTGFSVFEERRKTGRNRSNFTIIRFPSIGPVDFRIAKENFLTRMGKLIGFNDIEFNDYDIDRTFLFKSKDEKGFRTLMDHRRLNELAQRKESFDGALEGSGNYLQYVFRGQITDENAYDNVQSLMKLLYEFGKS